MCVCVCVFFICSMLSVAAGVMFVPLYFLSPTLSVVAGVVVLLVLLLKDKNVA